MRDGDYDFLVTTSILERELLFQKLMFMFWVLMIQFFPPRH